MLVIKKVEEYDVNDFWRLYESSWGGAVDTLKDIPNAEK